MSGLCCAMKWTWESLAGWPSAIVFPHRQHSATAQKQAASRRETRSHPSTLLHAAPLLVVHHGGHDQKALLAPAALAHSAETAAYHA
eukprot:CAMPEP_0172947130 /NCGR_PEP_ID=MMETSP1075-20121228/227414_1 /TAXON_ID=2916 /ORGANISM="Ceratium fusus, Strain PA161109" /LENGTH=86 /DNA_ID=CAMNT_0013808597 /DNA_START=855 /DNA_END=1111 /DNA_ORIENTATION=+